MYHKENKFSLCCSFGMFGAKFLCIFLYFFKIYKNECYLDEFGCVLSDVPTVITSLVLSFQEAKAKPKAAAKQLGGFLVFFFWTA